MIRKKSTLMIITYWLFEIGMRLAMYFKWDYFQLTKNDYDNEYLYIIFLNISDLIAFFPIIINYIKRKVNKNVEERIRPINNDENSSFSSSMSYNIDENTQILYLNEANKGLCKKLLILALIVPIDFLARSMFFIYHRIFDTDNEEVSQKLAHDILLFIDIIMRFTLYRFFFKLPPKRHHIFSQWTILAIFIVLMAIDCASLLLTKKYIILKCLIYAGILSFKSFLFPLADTICKKYMEEKYIFPWSYMFLRGIYELVYLIILTPAFIFTSILNFTSDIFTKKFFIISSIYIFCSFIKAGLLINLVYQYSSTFVSFLIMSEPLAGSIYEIINYFINKKDSNPFSIIITIFETILFVLIILTTLVFEEIYVIKCCKLNKDTKSEIERRSEQDNYLALENVQEYT